MASERNSARYERVKKYLSNSLIEYITTEQVLRDVFLMDKEKITHGMRIHCGRMIMKTGWFSRVFNNKGKRCFERNTLRESGSQHW